MRRPLGVPHSPTRCLPATTAHARRHVEPTAVRSAHELSADPFVRLGVVRDFEGLELELSDLRGEGFDLFAQLVAEGDAYQLIPLLVRNWAPAWQRSVKRRSSSGDSAGVW